MPKPVVVTISHSLGREAAVARLKDRLGSVSHLLGQYRVAVLKEQWTGDRLDFGVSALGQTVQGLVDVQDDHVRVEIELPWMLAAFAERIRSVVHRKAPALLGHDPKGE